MSSSRRKRSAPKANVSPSVRLGLASIIDGNVRPFNDDHCVP
jgi:hypothetical protein